MGLTKRSETQSVFLEVKHYSLWQPIKSHVAGCDVVDVTNPRTGATVTKHGYKFNTVTGRAVKLLKYDTEKKYSTRYFGFKLHLVDGAETFVLTMPYASQVLRRFLRTARNVDWALPLSISIFKGEKGASEFESTGVWFQQNGETVRAYYTRESPHGMPEPGFDGIEQAWDFREQHRWLIGRLQSETVLDIESAAAKLAPPIPPAAAQHEELEPDPNEPPAAEWIDATEPAEFHADASDVPF